MAKAENIDRRAGGNGRHGRAPKTNALAAAGFRWSLPYAMEDPLRAIHKGALEPCQPEYEPTRTAWRKAWRETVEKGPGYGKSDWDTLAARFHGGQLPPEIRHARAIEQRVSEMRRNLERSFVDGPLYGANPLSDHATIREAMRDCEAIVGPLPFNRPLSRAGRARRRLALMRFIDVCAASGYEVGASPPVTASIALAQVSPLLHDLFDSDSRGLFARTVATWPVKRAGAKPSSSGMRSKWKHLSELLQRVWGDSTRPEDLKKEWSADMKQTKGVCAETARQLEECFAKQRRAADNTNNETEPQLAEVTSKREPPFDMNGTDDTRVGPNDEMTPPCR